MTREEAKEKIIGAIWFAHGEGWGKNDEEVAELEQSVISIFEQQPCDDAISREELLKAIDTWDKFGYTETGCFVRITKEIDNYVPYVHLEDVITAIQQLPPVTQKSGKWIDTNTQDEMIGKVFKCEQCGEDFIKDYNFNFCPNCGAKMESEEV